ncbi:ubiquinol-cytochrome C reductase [Gluconobacter cerinus]|uniref:cytochrome c1 n=1 Tax=Gluconobacter cerinus TaxID=38307 RepID=UPI001B8C603D|nr:cytochrome c1 [Gluconobacter cerinus]MBS1072056.1 ubiquinol-cytochrome C reductase [Gluconobacter cerinus]
MKYFFLVLLAFFSFKAGASTPEQRGLQVFRQVCSSCHSLNYVAYSDLSDLGLSVAAIKDYASQHQVADGLDDDGDPKTRPAHPSDRIGSPYPSENLARLANHGGLPPDFSRLALTQQGGTARIIQILQSYASAPEGTVLPKGSYYNLAMKHRHIAMPQPLHDGQLQYSDGTSSTIPQMSQDVGAFLEWAAHPHLHTRHNVGVFTLLYLIAMSMLVFFLKKRIWKKVKN